VKIDDLVQVLEAAGSKRDPGPHESEE
jgi:hypothetical protein